jgi:hypothetical protein
MVAGFHATWFASQCAPFAPASIGAGAGGAEPEISDRAMPGYRGNTAAPSSIARAGAASPRASKAARLARFHGLGANAV